MAGDTYNIRVASGWTGSNPTNGTSSVVLTDLFSNLINGIVVVSAGKAVLDDLQNTNSGINNSLQNFLSTQPDISGKPKAYINWMLFDEQFKMVASNSSFQQVAASGITNIHAINNLPIDKSGYLYIYTSNESNNTDVFFDNLQVTHTKGLMLEETHYYPFGLTMAGISSKAAGSLTNKYKFGSKEMQSQEFSDGSGLEFYDFHARQQDYQIGRWTTIDPLADKFSSQSPYVCMDNNPVNIIDPTGMGGTSTHTDKDGNVLAVYNDGDLGIYKHDDAMTETDVDKRYIKNVMADKNDKSGGGTLMGRTLEWNSFLYEGDGAPLGKIKFGSTEAIGTIMQVMYKIHAAGGDKDDPEADLIRLADYMVNGTGGKKYDVKTQGGSDPGSMYRGSQISAGVYVSARDVGNFIAGRVASKYNVNYTAARIAFGALNLSNNASVGAMFKSIPKALWIGSSNNYGEKQISSTFQTRGYFNATEN